jgi:hypothetical protein
MATKAIPVVAAKVASTQTNFPVYIKPSAMTGWGSLTAAEANSIRFYSDSALTTELAREVVSADEIHVKVPSLTTTTTIYADYDGIRADYAVTDTYGRNAVWSGYRLAAHLQSDGTDSSGNLTATNTGVSFTSDGKLGSSAVSDDSHDRITYGTPNLFSGTKDFTLNLWIYRTGAGLWMAAQRTTVSLNWQLVYNAGSLYFQPNSSTSVFLGDLELAADTWYKITVTRSGTSTWRLYSNGTQVSTGTNSNSIGTGQTFSIYRVAQNEAGAIIGRMDEVRAKDNTAHSADWETTEYNNQNDVATFWGTVTDVGGASNQGFALWYA